MTEDTIFSSDLSPALITQIIVDDNKVNPKFHCMREADRYMENDNEYIMHKNRNYYDKEGNAYENKNASNVKLASSFLPMLVKQKQDYALSKSFVLKVVRDNEEVQATDKYYLAWKKFLDNKLFEMAYTLAGEAVNHGIAWCYVWIDENGELQLFNAQGDLVYAVWKDKNHTELDRLVYNYFTKTYRSLNPTIDEYAEYWDKENRILYQVNDGYAEKDIRYDEEGNPIHSQMMIGNTPISWERIPFVAFKSTDDEKPLLKMIKPYIDAYDELSSKSVDGLIDDTDPLLVFKGISSDIETLLEARELAKLTRTISLDVDGDASFIQAKTDINNNLTMKQDLRRDIFKFGYGVDYEDSRFNGNPNQMVIKSLFQGLDTFTDGLERNFQNFINDLKYFFDKWLEWKGEGSFADLQENKVLVKFDRAMMLNQSELIEDTVKLANTGVSQQTLLEFNPAVQDVELEKKRLEEEKEKAKQDNDNTLFNFANNNNNDDETENNNDDTENKDTEDEDE